MQKKLIALAIASAFSASAFAESTVNVYGVVDAAVVRLAADGQKSDIVGWSGGLATSRLGVKAVEDLDNGMKAVAVLEYALDTATSDTIGAARSEMLAVAGDFGTVAAGYLETTGIDFGKKYDVVAGSLVSPLQNLTKTDFYIGVSAAAARAQRAVAYISPKMGGLSFAINHSTAFTGTGNAAVASTAANAKIGATLVSADYAVDALTVGAVYLTTSNPTANSNVVEFALGAGYKMDAVALKATYQSTKVDTTGVAGSNNTVMSIGATAPVATGVVAVSYAKSSIGTAANKDASSYTVAFLQPMSKTTTAYAAYSATTQGTSSTAVSVANRGLGATAAGGGSSMIALGLSKKF
ncbi:MAG: porin [Gallionellaceae bacterium]|nr:porin [Gallionellaceae bacterium]